MQDSSGRFDTVAFAKGLIEIAGVARQLDEVPYEQTAAVEWRYVLHTIKTLFRQTGSTPTLPMVRHFLKSEDNSAYDIRYKFYLDQIETNSSSIEEMQYHVSIARDQAVSSMLLQASNDAASKDLSAAEHLAVLIDAVDAAKQVLDPIRPLEDLLEEDYRRNKEYALKISHKRFYGLFEPGEVHLLTGVSNSGKSSLAIWIGSHWASGQTFDRALDDQLAGDESLRVPFNGFMVYVGADLSKGEAVEKAVRFQRANLTDATTRSYPVDPEGDAEEEVTPFGIDRCFWICNSPPFQRQLLSTKLDEPGIDSLIRIVRRCASTIGNREFSREVLAPQRSLSAPTLRTGMVERTMVPPQPFVVLDSLASLLPSGTSESDNNAITLAMLQLQRLAQETDAVVVLLHHVSQQDHFTEWKKINPLTYGRGGTALAAKVRVIMALARVNGADKSTLGLKTVSNRFRPQDPWYFRTHEAGDLPGSIRYFKLIPKGEVDRLAASIDQEPKRAGLSMEDFLTSLRAEYPSGCSVTEARTLLAKAMGVVPNNDRAKKLWAKYRKALLASGRLSIRRDGRADMIGYP